MSAPIKRGTARRLGLHLPPGTYYTPLRQFPTLWWTTPTTWHAIEDEAARRVANADLSRLPIGYRDLGRSDRFTFQVGAEP